jgi:hypothetical protein
LTDADYKDAAVYLYTSLYGSASQQSISNYKDFKILLDKAGLGAYNGGAGVEMLSGNLDNIISKIGIINTNYGRWTIASNTDFSTGTYSNCYNNTGTVEISSSAYKWDTTADFTPAGTGSTQCQIKDDSVIITTQSGTGFTKLSLKPFRAYNANYFNENPANVFHTNSNLTESYNPGIGGYSWNNAVDGDENSYVAMVPTGHNSNCWYGFSFDSASTPVQKHLAKIRIKYQWAVYYGYGGFLISRPNYWTSINVNASKIETSLSDISELSSYSDAMNKTSIVDIDNPQEGSVNIKDQYSYIYNDTLKGNPSVIMVNMTPAAGIPTGNELALKIYELEAWFWTDSVQYSSAVYVSPLVSSAGATGQYQYLYASDNLSNKSTTSSDTIKYYASNNGSSWTYLGLSSGSYTSFPIPASLDGNTNFYWKAELYTSSITATPTIYDVSLQYATTGYATYKSKVFNVGKKITSWGSFLASYEGTSLFRVRASSRTYNLDVATLPESGANQWAYITSGSNLSTVITSTNNAFIQIEAQLHTKNTKIESLTATWFEGGEGSGGEQDVASINYRDRYYLAYSTWASYNTDVLVFDKNGRFTRYDWDVAGFTEFNNKLYFLSSTDNKIYQAFTGTDDAGTPYEMLWRSGDLDFGLKDLQKEYAHIYITGKKQSGSFAWLDTYVDCSTYTYRSIYCDLSADSNFRLQMSDASYGKNIAIVVRSTAPTCEIQSINLYYKVKTLR